METVYYTYCSYETDKGDDGLMYIGYRKCPEGETPWTDNYFGTPSSFDNLEFKEKYNKGKVVLGVFNSAEAAIAHEIELHNFYDVARNPKFANQARQTSTGFTRDGKSHSEEAKRKMVEAHAGKILSEETKRKLAEANAGENHPSFDPTLYNFKNEELGIVEMQVSRHYMAKKYGLNTSNLGGVVRGKCKHHKGWCLLQDFSN